MNRICGHYNRNTIAALQLTGTQWQHYNRNTMAALQLTGTQWQHYNRNTMAALQQEHNGSTTTGTQSRTRPKCAKFLLQNQSHFFSLSLLALDVPSFSFSSAARNTIGRIILQKLPDFFLVRKNINGLV